MPMIRVMLVDDHAVVRAGYRRLLEMESDLVVVAECADADAAYDALQRQPVSAGPLVDVVVLDLSMPGRSGLDLLRRLTLRWPSLRVLVFTMHDSAAMVSQCLRAGAAGFVTKSSQPEELVLAVRQVMGQGIVLSDDVAAVVRAVLEDAERPPHTTLSPREFDVLRYLVDGLGVDEIAERLTLSAKTVANYQTMIRQKLGVGNAVELLRYVREHRLFAGGA
jgi:two-component system, NarL family, response regulator FusR